MLRFFFVILSVSKFFCHTARVPQRGRVWKGLEKTLAGLVAATIMFGSVVSADETKAAKQTDGATAVANPKPAARNTKNFTKPGATAVKSPELTPRMIAAAQEFAATHHPELSELLVRLETYDKTSFIAAIEDVHKAMQRIERMGEKNAERGRVELEDWKLTSRIRLLVARLAMTGAQTAEAAGDESLLSIKESIRELLIERSELRKSSLLAERGRLTERLEKVNKQLADLSERERQTIERELDRLESNASQAKSRQQKAVPAKALQPKNRQKSDSDMNAGTGSDKRKTD